MKVFRIHRGSRFILILVVLALVFGLTFLTLLAIRTITGRSLGLRNFASTQIFRAKAVMDSLSTPHNSSGNLDDIIFLHHSTGNNLIVQGGVRELFTQAGYNFWDHGYNGEGLRGPNGVNKGYNYFVPGDNTNPDGFANVFSQKIYSLPLNTLSGLLQHDVIAFKSCFPANHITSNAQLEEYKAWYLEMRQVMNSRPDKVFIIVTIPPLDPVETNPEEAARARVFANWLKSEEFLSGYPNIYTFDFFNLLAEDNLSAPDANMLRAEYRNGNDSHPNQIANETIGPLFVDFIVKAIEDYRTTRGGR